MPQDPLVSLAPRMLSQLINPWFVNMGVVTMDGQAAGDAQIEEEIVNNVASYGKQLGRICAVLEVLIKQNKLEDPSTRLDPDDRIAINSFRTMLLEIDNVKLRHRPDGVMAREFQRWRRQLEASAQANGRVGERANA
jgi:hypothetical protein